MSTGITQNMLHNSENLTWSNNFVWVWKMAVDETEELQQSVEDIPRNTTSELQRLHAAWFQFL